MKELIILLVTAVVCITILECFALMNGINGNMFGLSVAAIGGIVGAGLDHYMKKRKMILDSEKDKR